MRQSWVWVSAAVILAVTGMFIARLRLSEIPDLAVGHSPKPPALGEPRERSVVYEVDGPEGVSATASYLGADGLSHDLRVRLPWAYRTTSRELTLPAGVTASADGADLGCRVTVDGAIRIARQGLSVVGCQVPVS